MLLKSNLPGPNGSSYEPLMTANCRTSDVDGPQSSFGLPGYITNPGAFVPTLLLTAVASSRLLENVYTPRNWKPLVRRWLTSMLSALYELRPSVSHVMVFASFGFASFAPGG